MPKQNTPKPNGLKAKRAPSPEDPSDPPALSKARLAAEMEIELLEGQLSQLQSKLEAARERLQRIEEEEEEEDELPVFKADGTLDLRFKSSKQMLRKDGGLNRSYKAVRKAIEKGLITEDGMMIIVVE